MKANPQQSCTVDLQANSVCWSYYLCSIQDTCRITLSSSWVASSWTCGFSGRIHHKSEENVLIRHLLSLWLQGKWSSSHMYKPQGLEPAAPRRLYEEDRKSCQPCPCRAEWRDRYGSREAVIFRLLSVPSHFHMMNLKTSQEKKKKNGNSQVLRHKKKERMFFCSCRLAGEACGLTCNLQKRFLLCFFRGNFPSFLVHMCDVATCTIASTLAQMRFLWECRNIRTTVGRLIVVKSKSITDRFFF